MKTQCCNYEIDNEKPPVMWNEFNNVVQCHNCGQVYVPKIYVTLQEVATHLLGARMSNPKLVYSVKGKNSTPEEARQRSVNRAKRAVMDARALLEVLNNER